MGILPKKIQVVSEEEDKKNKTIAEREEVDDVSVWMHGEDKTSDDLRYIGEVRKIIVLPGACRRHF